MTGSIWLIVPTPNAERPPFCRLHGIERFPDVPFVGEDGDELRPARTTDPPIDPPGRSADAAPLTRLHETAQRRDWEALGLEDADATSRS